MGGWEERKKEREEEWEEEIFGEGETRKGKQSTSSWLSELTGIRLPDWISFALLFISIEIGY